MNWRDFPGDTGHLLTCAAISAWTDTWQLFNFDNDRMMTLLEDGYECRIPNDTTRVLIGNYVRSSDERRALKRSRAVPCSIFSHIEEQTATRGNLAKTLARHRINALFSAFLKGLQISPMAERARFQAGEPTGFAAEMISGMPNRTRDGLSRAAAVFSGFILDVGEFRHDEKSMNIAELLVELFEQTYKECRDEISKHVDA